jgi:hypothetical protein
MVEKSRPSKKSEGKPLYGSQEAPARESVSAPANTGAKTGKPRPPSD